MDPSTHLDHAHFQLTPTRTRCDLVIVAGGVNERLASGLLEPFLSHLKSAKDQISKGGYSITLRPASAHAPWFTKATLQRFVRFVSTPEVLERVVTIEKEIVQIESSIQSNEKNNSVAEAEGNVSSFDGRVRRSTSSSKDELAGTNQNGHEENSRLRLHRVLDNRKAMLCKEQAMAYARALVAGFYPESLDDLIYFSDAFGASRLREACINFLDLCKQKNEDKLWIDEIAAMQASHPELPYLKTSGIILAGEDDTSSKLNGFGDASISESTASHASFDINQDNSLPTSAQTPLADGRAQIPMSWPNHLPHYIHNFQGPPFQQMPPYHGYLYPGMQVPSSHYPGNMQWPPHVEDSHSVLDREMDYHKSSFKKKKKKHSQVLEHSEDVSTASSNSSYETDSDEHSRQDKKHSSTEHQHKKKHGKKSSRKVVIRNINYITSNGDGEKGSIREGSLSNEEEFIDRDSLKHQVEEAVVSLERRHKSSSHRHKKQHSAKHPGMQNGSTDADSNGVKGNDNWDAFQNLLLRDDESTPDTEEKQPMEFQEEYILDNEFNHKQGITKTRVVSNDSFIMTRRELDSEGQNQIECFKEGRHAPSFMKKKDRTDEELLFSQRNEEPGSYSVSSLSLCGPESSRIKCQKEEDWFIVNQSDKPANEDGNKNFIMLNGVSNSSSEKNKKDILADDSFMIQTRSSENQFNSQSAADISLVSDIVGATEFANSTQEGSHNKTETLNSHEPDDLFMVLDRDSAVEQSAAHWNMEMDFANNIPLNEANRKLSDVETDKKQLSNGEGTKTKTPGVRNGKVSSKSKVPNASLGKSKSDVMSRSKASQGSRTTVTKSKSEKEEESRKRKEELLIQRQKRIAERSASKKTGTETKTSFTSAKKEKPKIHPSSEETKKLNKPVLRNSTIERLATARVSQKVTPTQAKSGPSPTKKPSLKANVGVPSQKTAGTEKKKQAPKEVKSSNQKEDKKKTNGEVIVDSNGQAKNEMEASVVLPVNSGAVQSVEPYNSSSGLKDIVEVSKTSSEKHTRNLFSEREHVLENVGQLHIDSSLPNHDRASRGNLSKGEVVLDKLSSLPDDDKPQPITDVVVNPTAVSPSMPLNASGVNTKVNQEIHETNAVSPPKVSWKLISTPPTSDQLMPEPIHSRKKWNSHEDSSKAAKGFRKLLFFGRKS